MCVQCGFSLQANLMQPSIETIRTGRLTALSGKAPRRLILLSLAYCFSVQYLSVSDFPSFLSFFFFTCFLFLSFLFFYMQNRKVEVGKSSKCSVSALCSHEYRVFVHPKQPPGHANVKTPPCVFQYVCDKLTFCKIRI